MLLYRFEGGFGLNFRIISFECVTTDDGLNGVFFFFILTSRACGEPRTVTSFKCSLLRVKYFRAKHSKSSSYAIGNESGLLSRLKQIIVFQLKEGNENKRNRRFVYVFETDRLTIA